MLLEVLPGSCGAVGFVGVCEHLRASALASSRLDCAAQEPKSPSVAAARGRA